MKRYPGNPILTRKDIPVIPPRLVDVTSVFNPGAVLFREKFLLMLRVQNRGRETFFLTAESHDGVHFDVSNRPVHFRGLDNLSSPVYHCYDARITQLEGMFLIMFAMDMDSGCHLGLARTENFEDFDFLGITTTEDTRNGVLFPEKVDGKYLRLDRPNKVAFDSGLTTGNTIVLSESQDLLCWQPVAPVISGRLHYWDELVGAGPPPVKTREGWLEVYHGVATHLSSIFIYQVGILLLDLKNPARVIARGPCNILEPREPYELMGQVPNVVFPSGLIVKHTDDEGFALPESEVVLYYGAADTVVCVATSTVGELTAHARGYGFEGSEGE